MHGSDNPKGEDKPPIDIDLLLPFQISQLNAKLAAQARAIIARHGTLSLPEWRIIRVVGMGVATGSTAVRKAAGIDKSQFSRTVNSLVEDGYVKVHPSSEDRRQFELSLTSKGHATHERLAPELNARQRHLLDALSPAERAVIHSAIRALARAAEQTEFNLAIDGKGTQDSA
jgi:DNA-binding MarR family transcriptional regulator